MGILEGVLSSVPPPRPRGHIPNLIHVLCAIHLLLCAQACDEVQFINEAQAEEQQHWAITTCAAETLRPRGLQSISLPCSPVHGQGALSGFSVVSESLRH